MLLKSLLDVNSPEEIDTARPLEIDGRILGIEAAQEAAKLIESGGYAGACEIKAYDSPDPYYWQIHCEGNVIGEIFTVCKEIESMPTSIEVGMVKALSCSKTENQDKIICGGVKIILGDKSCFQLFSDVTDIVTTPAVGTSRLWLTKFQVEIISTKFDLNQTPIKCLLNSFQASPLKFRFLEIYRVLESLFIGEIKSRLFSRFDSEPGVAVETALHELRSELSQLSTLAEREKEVFEACRAELAAIKNTNRFVAALFHKINRIDKSYRSSEWKFGAALIYFTRCAIVHAGQKDLIFENFPDGDEALDYMTPLVEDCALLLLGLRTF